MGESIATLSDIHANLPALEAVLADIESYCIREILCRRCCGQPVE